MSIVQRKGAIRSTAVALAALLAVVLAVAGCGTIGGSDTGGGNDSTTTEQGDSGGGSGKTLTIGWIPWDEDIVVTHMWKQVLEDAGYTVKLVQLEPGALYAGLARGDIDLFLDGWLPITHETYWEKYGDQLEDLGVWYDNAKLTIAVPDYVKDVRSIADLKGNASKFGGKIVGIEAGAGLTTTTETKTMPAYGLDGEYELAKSSTPAMLAELDKAIKAKEPIVVTLWRPHWAYAKLPVRDLEDPKGTMGATEKIHAVGRKGFSEEFPELASWLSSFSMNDETLGTLEHVALQEYKGREAEGVTAWMKDNSEFVTNLTAGDSTK